MPVTDIDYIRKSGFEHLRREDARVSEMFGSLNPIEKLIEWDYVGIHSLFGLPVLLLNIGYSDNWSSELIRTVHAYVIIAQP